MARVSYNDKINSGNPECHGIVPEPIVLDVHSEIKLWGEKWFHAERHEPGSGDDISFILSFGNDGELTCTASETEATVEDILEIRSPMHLKLMSLSAGNEYEVWVVGENSSPVNYEVTRGHIFQAGVYKLQLRKKVPGSDATPYFDVPCHYIGCVAMLFQIRFPECMHDCISRPVENGCFEDGLNGWTQDEPEGASIEAVATFSGTADQYINIYNGVDGGNFALLQTGEHSGHTSLSQTISVCPGDRIQGLAFFYTDLATETPETPAPSFNDRGSIEILDINGNIINIPFSSHYTGMGPTYGITDWNEFNHTFADGGTYVIRGVVTRSEYAEYNSYLGMDCLEIVKTSM